MPGGVLLIACRSSKDRSSKDRSSKREGINKFQKIQCYTAGDRLEKDDQVHSREHPMKCIGRSISLVSSPRARNRHEPICRHRVRRLICRLLLSQLYHSRLRLLRCDGILVSVAHIGVHAADYFLYTWSWPLTPVAMYPCTW